MFKRCIFSFSKKEKTTPLALYNRRQPQNILTHSCRISMRSLRSPSFCFLLQNSILFPVLLGSFKSNAFLENPTWVQVHFFEDLNNVEFYFSFSCSAFFFMVSTWFRVSPINWIVLQSNHKMENKTIHILSPLNWIMPEDY